MIVRQERERRRHERLRTVSRDGPHGWDARWDARAREYDDAMRTEAMGSYRGPARVVTDAGEVYQVMANLSSTIQRERVGDRVIEGLTDWGGYLTGSDVPWFKFGQTGEAITVVVGDREGSAWVRRFNVASPEGPVTILGSSAPPFDSGTG